MRRGRRATGANWPWHDKRWAALGASWAKRVTRGGRWPWRNETGMIRAAHRFAVGATNRVEPSWDRADAARRVEDAALAWLADESTA